jgi:RHS repeat-associated protein
MNKLFKFMSILALLFLSINGFAADVKILSSGKTVKGSVNELKRDHYEIATGPGDVAIEVTGDVIFTVSGEESRSPPTDGERYISVTGTLSDGGEVYIRFYCSWSTCPSPSYCLWPIPENRICTFSIDKPTNILIGVSGGFRFGDYTLTATFNEIQDNQLILEKVPTSLSATQEPYTVQLQATDSEDNLQEIQIDWTNRGGLDGQLESQTASSGEVVTFTHTYPNQGSFTWTAVAYDANGNKSNIVSGTLPEIGKRVEEDYEKCKNLAGDPIDVATGAQLLNHDLLTVQGVLPLSFRINYHSLLQKEGILGRAWGHNRFDARLQELSNGDVKIHWTTNQSNVFTKNADGTYNSSHVTCRFDILVKNADGGFTLTRKNQILYEFDAAGQLVALRNRQGQSLTLTRDEAGRMKQVTEPVSGAFLRYAYNAEGLLETVSDPLGRQVRFGYDSNRNLTTITDAAGQTTTYTYNEFGQTLTGTHAGGVQFFSNTYDEEYRIVAQEDAVTSNQPARLSFDDSQPNRIITTFTNRNGHTQVYTYDDNYYLLSFQDELGNITHYAYDANGKRTSATDVKGNTTHFEYDANGNLTKITDAKGGITQMVYDANSNLLSVTNALGKTSTFSYDDNNNRTSVTDALGNTTRYTYNSHGQVVTETGPSGAVTTYEYENGLPVRVTDPEGNTQTLRYDAAGRLLSTTDAEGHTTTFAYDGVNRLVSVTDALNRTVSMTYDSRDNLLTLTDAKGHVTRRSYEGNGNLISQINALAQETRYKYDGEGRLVKVIDAKGHVTQLGYDAKGRLISTTNALGNTQQLSYDAADNLLAEIDALGNTVAAYRYDELNNPLSVTNALGHQTQSAYDALGRLTRVTDPLNWATQFNYDNNDRLVASVDAKGGQSRQTFDAEGNLTGLTDPNNHQTTFQFDNNGRLVQEASASGGRVRYSYNARDLLATITNARGQQRQFEYDAVGRLTSLTAPDGTVSYTYDDNDNVLTVTDANGTISREYDALDRVVKYTDSQGNTLQYAYDAVGNLETLTYPDGKQVFYEYDAADQLTQVTDWAGRKTRYAYDANGRLVEVVRPNGTHMTYTYNVAGQLVQQQDVASNGDVIRQFDFVYDAAGDIIKEAVVPEPTPFPFIPATMTYTAANRLATYNGEAVTFDADGNMTLGPLNGELVYFTFDARNRLINVGDTAYRYDAENQRIAVNVAGQATRYVIDSQPVLSQTLVRTAPDGTQTFYVYGLGLIGQETGSVYQAYHFDLRGSTVALSDATGNVVEQFQYSPFGGLVTHSPADVDTPFLYNGRDGVMTDDTGLYYMRARYSNPETRRFVNRDVLLGGVADGQSLNRFAYVTGEPISHIDPTGKILASALGYLAYVGVPMLVRYAPVIMRSAQNAYRQVVRYAPVIMRNAQNAYRQVFNKIQSAAYKYGHIITPRVEPIKDIGETLLMDGPYANSKAGRTTYLLNNVIFNENLAADIFLVGVSIGEGIGKIIYCNSSEEAPRIIHKVLNESHKVLNESHTVRYD